MGVFRAGFFGYEFIRVQKHVPIGCMWRPEVDIRCPPQLLSTLSFESGSLCGYSAHWFSDSSWLVSFRDLPVSTQSLSQALAGGSRCHIWAFHVGAGGLTQVLTLPQHLRHLPSPGMFLEQNQSFQEVLTALLQ